jgi:hypothetical protein
MMKPCYSEHYGCFLRSLLSYFPMIEVIEIPLNLIQFQLPDGVQARLHSLLDCQDEGGFFITGGTAGSRGFGRVGRIFKSAPVAFNF